jgi:hypothetical protein
MPDKPFVVLSCRLELELDAAFNEWRRRQPKIPSRSDALRELLDRGMRAVIDPPRKQTKLEHQHAEETVTS